MRDAPEATCTPKRGKEISALKLWNKRQRLLVAAKINTVSGRLTALFSEESSIGSLWIPVGVNSEHQAQALAAWWNTTPVRLMLLNHRAKMLTYPTWSLQQLREIRIPRPENPAWDALADAWHEACDIELLPMKHAPKCKARRIIDRAAAIALGIDEAELAEWRERLAKEPTITNRPAA